MVKYTMHIMRDDGVYTKQRECVVSTNEVIRIPYDFIGQGNVDWHL